MKLLILAKALKEVSYHEIIMFTEVISVGDTDVQMNAKCISLNICEHIPMKLGEFSGSKCQWLSKQDLRLFLQVGLRWGRPEGPLRIMRAENASSLARVLLNSLAS